MKICFTGDLFLGGDLLNKNIKNLINVNIFNNADKRIVNLEQAISESNIVENKGTLYTGKNSIKQLHDLKVDAVNLAHNHIQDKGLEGIVETISYLRDSHIGFFGAGSNIIESKKPFRLNDQLVVIGYCEFDKIYLNQIEVAGESKAGVNPLRYDSIISDLEKLDNNQKAILYFHWGREHVSLPLYQDIQLVKKLLRDERVVTIIGMHPHRPQGFVKVNGKKAFMSLGNFLFPNFFIKPPTQIFYPESVPKKYSVTRQYHEVFGITYKKWRLINRISIVLSYDTESNKVIYKFVKQSDNEPKVEEINKFFQSILFIFYNLVSLIYKLPKPIYKILEKINTGIVYKLWKFRIRFFHFSQKKSKIK
jgi:poly-gamma-glutamate synthesis protein (capsule biosynthesis protein)